MSSQSSRFASFLYRHRWPLAAVTVLGAVLLATLGVRQIAVFSSGVESLKERPEQASAPPRIFDARYDIWFDPEDSGLRTYQDIEAQFIAEDTILVAFEEPDHPWGVFSPAALETVARLTEAIERVPYVRHVRSLTTSPWIRWGDAGDGEEGLLVTDLFEDAPTSYSESARLERMIAVLGARGASRLVGEDAVRRHLGEGASFGDHIGEPRLIRGVISENGRTTALQIQLLRDKVDEELLAATFPDDSTGTVIAPSMHANESQWQALQAITDIVDSDSSNYQFHIAGMPVFERNLMVVGMGDMVYVLLMFAVIAIVLLALFRRASGVVIPLLVVFSTILGMLGAIWLAGDLLNNLTAIAPNMIMAIGIASAVHLLAAYYLLRPDYDSKQELIIAAIRKNAVPVFLTSVTTAVGFFSLMSSDIIPMQMLGYTGGIGTIMAYLVSMTLVPALLSLVPFDGAKQKKRRARAQLRPEVDRPHWGDRLVPFVLRNRGAITLVSLATVAVALAGLSRVNITSDFREMFPDSDRMIVDQDWIESRLAGTGDLEIVFYGAPFSESTAERSKRQLRLSELEVKELIATEPLSSAEKAELATLRARQSAHQARRIGANHAFLEQVDRFEQRLLSEASDPNSPLRIISRIDSPLDVLRKMNQAQNRNLASEYRVPGPADVPEAARQPRIEVDEITEEAVLIPAQTASSLASQYYVQYENGAKPGENLSRLLTADRRGFRLAASIRQAETREQQAAFARIREIAETEFPELAGSNSSMSEMTMTGKLYLFANMIDRFTRSLLLSLSIALAIITLLIAIFFRSAVIGLISIVPNVLPLLLPLGVLGLLGIPLDGPAVLVVSVALGICVDDTIHFFSKFYDAQRAGATLEQALQTSFRQVGSALTSTTVILVLGFSVLMLSDFRPNLLIGQLAIVMIALAWVADFIVTPALLGLVVKRQRRADATTTSPIPQTA